MFRFAAPKAVSARACRGWVAPVPAGAEWSPPISMSSPRHLARSRWLPADLGFAKEFRPCPYRVRRIPGTAVPATEIPPQSVLDSIALRFVLFTQNRSHREGTAPRCFVTRAGPSRTGRHHPPPRRHASAVGCRPGEWLAGGRVATTCSSRPGDRSGKASVSRLAHCAYCRKRGISGWLLGMGRSVGAQASIRQA